MPPYITPMLSMLCLNCKIHYKYSNFCSSLKSFDISNTHQCSLITLMSNKAHPFLFSCNFKMILDTRKIRKNFFFMDSFRRSREFLLAFLLLSIFIYFYNFQTKNLISIYWAEKKHSAELISTLKCTFHCHRKVPVQIPFMLGFLYLPQYIPVV